MNAPLSSELLRKLNAYWRAANYLSVGQIYLFDNPLLKEPLQAKHIKPRLLGHWGTTPGLNFIYAHLNRVIKERDLNMIYVIGPGHGGPALVANAYLEGTYSEVYPNISQDEEGMKRLFTQFSFPGGIPSHVAPETPGSIHEGGELGYALSHAFGAAFDNPNLIVAAVVGDGEAETGPLATSWHSNKFLNPIGYAPRFVGADGPEALTLEPTAAHQQMAATLDEAIAEIKSIQDAARTKGFQDRPRWPMIILRSPKGWTGPHTVDGKPTEGTFRSHQVPMAEMDKPEHIQILETWMKSYKAEELFDATGRLKAELAELAPQGLRRMSANPHANGGVLLRDLRMPNFEDYAVDVPTPGAVDAESCRVQGQFIRDVMKLNWDSANFRVFSPDETSSNRWDAVFEVTNRCSTAEIIPIDDHVAADGRVMEMLSEHQCEGWLEGYLLTGRHGFFSCYEAFIHIIDSM
ncbi:MAG: phosphoketolase family protein, partial [Candidatus Sumerlaeota bacterium]|nr:phosphoketolase family protein [Candidatus Sumerlaeota bacterium]